MILFKVLSKKRCYLREVAAVLELLLNLIPGTIDKLNETFFLWL
jgi:hypothetical protein